MAYGLWRMDSEIQLLPYAIRHVLWLLYGHQPFAISSLGY